MAVLTNTGNEMQLDRKILKVIVYSLFDYLFKINKQTQKSKLITPALKRKSGWGW